MPAYGTMPGQFPIPAEGTLSPPGTPPGPGGSGGVAPSKSGVGWEIFVRSYVDYTKLLCQVPPKMINQWQFVKQLNDLGSGTITLNMDDPWWNAVVLSDGAPTTEILDYECLWQVAQDGVVRFEFLGETITEQLVDPSEQRLVTVTGPGTIAVLKWAMAAPEGFPNIVLKLDGLADTFDEVDGNGNPILDTNVWTVASPAADVYITPVAALYDYPGGAKYDLQTLYPTGSLSIVATSGTTVLGSTPWDATDTLISASVTPIGAANIPTDANGNPEAYGSGLNGSEITQFYIQSLRDSTYVAMIGLSATAFYCLEVGPDGTKTKVMPAYNATNHAYWMITEQAGSGGGPGTFYFWTSPDESTWTQQWSVVHQWDATYAGFYVTATYTAAGQSVQLTDLNGNVTTPSYNGNIYLQQPIMGIWYDILATAEARGTIPFVGTSITPATDSYGHPWTDSQSVQVTNGTDLYTLLQSATSTINADFCMQPGFNLQVGITEQGSISLGVDRSQQIILNASHDELTKTRTRTRSAIENLIGAENSEGREISASDPSSIGIFGQREGWYQTGAQVDPVSMEVAAAAAVEEAADEVLTWTLTIPPKLAGKTIFENFDVGDWVGLERPNYSAVDEVRVVGIGVSMDDTGLETNELTLVSYLAYVEQQLTYITNKMGGSLINIQGCTPVAVNQYGIGQVPTYFNPAASLANLSDVVGTGASNHASPLVYNAITGMYQAAGTSDQTGGTVPLSVGSGTGSVVLSGSGVVISSGASGAPAPDGGGPNGSTPRVVIGQQGDGTVTTVEQNAPPPNAPDLPTVAGGVLGLIVAWDGKLAGAAPLSDFLWVEVHVSTTSGFTPSNITLQGTMTGVGLFGVGGLTAGTTYYCKLLARNRSLTPSVPSTQQTGVPQSVGGSITTGSIPGTAIVTGSITTTQIATNAGILGSQLSAAAGITAAQVSFTASAIGGVVCTVGTTAPTSPSVGDLWFNGNVGYQLQRYNGSAWVAYQFGTNAIAAGSVTAALIAANTITATQIAAGTITSAQIAANTITAGQIAAGTITAAQIASGTITASLLAAGIVVAGIVDATTITGAQLIADGAAGQVLVYAGTPQSGNLVFSVSGIPYTDSFGNSVPAGIGLNTGSISGTGIDSSSITNTSMAGGSSQGVSITSPTISGGVLYEADVVMDSVDGQLFVYSSTTAQVVLTPSSSGSWVAPAGVSSVKVECQGAGSSGSGGGSSEGGETGGGGEYACEPNYNVIPGRTYYYQVGNGGSSSPNGTSGNNGGDTWFDNQNVYAQGGQAGTAWIAGPGGNNSNNSIHYPGGNGVNAGNTGGGGGGGGAGSTGPGGNGGASPGTTGGSAGSAGPGSPAGGHGGAGGNSTANGAAGVTPGGAGGGAGDDTTSTQVTKTYNCNTIVSYYGSDATSNANTTRVNGVNTFFQGGETASGGTANGTQKSIISFGTTIAGDLSGLTIDKVTLRLYCQHSWYSTGITVVLGYTSYAANAIPAIWNGVSNLTHVKNFNVGEGDIQTQDLTSTGIGAALKSGAAKTISFGPGSAYALANYGYFYGPPGNTNNCPQLVVVGHTGASTTYSGAGGDGQLTLTYTSTQVMTNAISPLAGTDGVSSWPAGISAIEAGVDYASLIPASGNASLVFGAPGASPDVGIYRASAGLMAEVVSGSIIGQTVSGWYPGGVSTGRASTTALAADPYLTVPAVANAAYRVELYLCYNGGSGASEGGIQWDWSIPSGAYFQVAGLFPGFSANTVTSTNQISTDSSQYAYTGGVTTGLGLFLGGTLLTAGSAGSLTFNWAQHSSNGTNTHVTTGSVLCATRIG